MTKDVIDTLRERHFAIIGGAGFIGSHFADSLLALDATQEVVIYDNFTSGQHWHLEHHLNDKRLKIVKGQIADSKKLEKAITKSEVVIHLASNPDIAAAMLNPAIDFDEGTHLTHRVLEAMRVTKARRILYASGSGVYGDLGNVECSEEQTLTRPVSTYGASKLAGEALIAAYSHMFGFRGTAFRFGNVVGPRQTHGVAFDFVRKLLQDPLTLTILGNGEQSKSYIHVSDVVKAVLDICSSQKTLFDVFNVATGDYISVNEIARIVIEELELNPAAVVLDHTPGDRGWKGDVPIVRLSTEKIKSTGWTCNHSTQEAIKISVKGLLKDENRRRLMT
jgi:UDP-glucose 4-epimerase